MYRRILLATAAAALATPAFAADKVLTVAASVFPDSLRAGTSSYATESLLNQTNEMLVTRDNKGDLHPALATSW